MSKTADGLLLVNKPQGITSHDVVANVRRFLRRKDIGHAGTLDPLASGLMVLLLGEATKISDYVLSGEKGYTVRARLGIATDMLDITGVITERREVNVAPAVVHDEALALQGHFLWSIPIYSAKKIDGEKLYERARRGEEFVSPKKEMRFWDVAVLKVEKEAVEARLRCSKGSFIRTWVDEFGKKLGTLACMEELCRTWSAPYSLESAVDLAELEAGVDDQVWSKWTEKGAFVPLANTLMDWPTVTVKGRDERLLHNGQISFDLERRLIPVTKSAIADLKPQGVRVLSADSGALLAILEAQPGRGLKIRRVFH